MKMLAIKPSKFYVEIISIRIYVTILYYMQLYANWTPGNKRERERKKESAYRIFVLFDNYIELYSVTIFTQKFANIFFI